MRTYYDRYVDKLLAGEVRRPRNLKTYSIQNTTFAVKTGTTYRRKGDNPLIGFMEGLQFVAGIFKHDQIARIAPRAKLDLFTDQAAYGPRVGKQIFDVIEELRNDDYSRRAVIILARPDEALENRPCTTSLQFRANKFGNVLDTIVSMRSSDAVWGLPYDLIQFGLISQVIAACVGMFPGTTIINIGDAHIYESTLHLAKDFELWKFEAPLTGDGVVSRDIMTHRIHSRFLIEILNKHTLRDFRFEKVDTNG